MLENVLKIVSDKYLRYIATRSTKTLPKANLALDYGDGKNKYVILTGKI